MPVELKIPTAGESITEVQIGQWLKSEGEAVAQDELVVEIETDKASMELPAPVSGIVKQHLYHAGDIVPVGTVIALLEPAEVGAAASPQKAAAPAAAKSAGAGAKAGGAGAKAAGAAAQVPAAAHTSPAGEPRVMPAARRALAEAGASAGDVTPTGPGGRVLKEDVARHVAEGAAAGAGASAAAGTSAAAAAAASPLASGPRTEEAVPMSMLRRRIAQRLVEAKQVTAMLTTFNEVDMSAVLALRKECGESFEKKYGVRLGFMSFFVKAAIDALKQFPAVNGEIRGNDIVYKNYYDVGVAVSTEHGLVVPVIRNAERLSFAEIEKSIADLAGRARARTITVEELQGGTFTITNGGVFGSLLATPILNYPQAAILGLHAMKDRPVALDGQVVIRPMMYVALTYDHRIIDGRESVSFLVRVKQCIESPSRMLVES